MKTFLFKTHSQMKPYNRDKYFIINDFVKEIGIDAETLNDALVEYAETLNNDYGIFISQHALRAKNPMFTETPRGDVQTGYVITGKTDFRDDARYCWVTQFIDLWVKIQTLTETEF